MKEWIKNNWNTFFVGYSVGATVMWLLEVVADLILKIIMLTTQAQP